MTWRREARREEKSGSGSGGEEKNFQPLPGHEPPIIQSVGSSIQVLYIGMLYIY
jgi:hypothetical protein